MLIDIDPIFFKYHPNIGIFNNSFFKINIGELKIVCKKKVSNIDWWDEAIKNFSLVIIFAFPFTITLVDKKSLKQILDHWPISFPPNNTIEVGIKSPGKNRIEIQIIPKKKKNRNRNFLIILLKN